MRLTDKDIVEAFISKCKQYKGNQKQARILQAKLEEINTRRYGVGAVSQKEVIIENHPLRSFDFDAMDEADRVKLELLSVQALIYQVDRTLEKIEKDTAEMIREAYINGDRLQDVTLRHYVSIHKFYDSTFKEIVRVLSE